MKQRLLIILLVIMLVSNVWTIYAYTNLQTRFNEVVKTRRHIFDTTVAYGEKMVSRIDSLQTELDSAHSKEMDAQLAYEQLLKECEKSPR